MPSPVRLRRLSRTPTPASDPNGGTVTAAPSNGVAASPSHAALAPSPAAQEADGANGAPGRRAIARVLAESPPSTEISQSTERVAARQAAHSASTASPASATTDATRLAALSGGALVDAPDGRAGVVFPSAGQQAGGSARTTSAATAQRAVHEPVPATAAIDVDDLYDQIAARLRRELLLDRERAGELP